MRLLPKKIAGGKIIFAALIFLFAAKISAATVTLQTNIIGSTPAILGYNLSHFYPGSNTRDWWRYAGVNGARIFISPSQIESAGTIAAAAGLVGVSNQASFLACRAAMHTNQFNPNYIPWSSITNNYNSNDLYPVNHILVAPALTALHNLGIQICAQITASQSTFPITDTNDWPDLWGLWHHYYAQAFYLGRYFDVQRFEIYNEPNASGGPTQTNFLLRLQFASDAISNALADVNSLYGKTLSPVVLAPTLAGGAVGHWSDWGLQMVTNRHVNFLGQSNPNFLLFQKYDYHQYDSSPGTFGSDLATLNADLQSTMSPETPLPAVITEFNTHTAANFDNLTNTLDTPTEYADLGSICNELLTNQASELYAFKFSQVGYAGSYPVQKNAMFYVDNTNSPYNIGGISKGGEVYRLFNKGFAAGRTRLKVTESSGAASLETHASYDPATQCYHLFSANSTASAVSLNLDLSALNLPASNHILLEEVSETNYGSGLLWTNLPANSVVAAAQNANTVWLLTAPARPQQAEQIIFASDDAEVRDGANKNVNYGSATTMTARNDSASTANRRAALMKFHLPTTNFAGIEFALLSLPAACATSNCVAQAHVYFLTNTAWTQSAVTWSSAPNLRQNIPAGAKITNSVIQGVGTNASIVGQIVVTTTTVSEKIIDLTDFLRGQTNQDFSILIVQDPRWDVALPALTTGDVQPDGVQIATTESGSGPRLRLVMAATNAPAITGISAKTNGSLVFNFSGLANNQLRVQATTNLADTNWLNLTTNFFSTGGAWNWTNFDVTNFPQRFYRVVSP